ncbi:MAG: FHA domain-containing protein [Syntrophobacteraceae bacterium]|nr:FHA domain-containing protein [Syntrophobacteraceae bacterium]
MPFKASDQFTNEDYIFTVKRESESVSAEPVSAEKEITADAAMNTVFVGGKDIQVEWSNFPLEFNNQDRIVIGRTPDNGVVLNHPTISRYHAVIERMGTRFRITDLHSANGTYLNGRAIDAPEWIKPNDTIKIGPCEFLFTGVGLQGAQDSGVTIEALHLKKQVNPKTNLLQDISLSIGANEFVAIVGTSGAGKTSCSG